jgi:intein-encoded DNA endonuclease-like protein
MPKLSKIEQHGLEKDVLDWTSQGMSSRDISAKIMEEKKIYISHASIVSFIKFIREERAETSRAIVQEHMQKTLPNDLELVDEMNGELSKWFKDKSLSKRERLRIYDSLLRGIEMKLKNSGAGENSTEDFLKALKQRWGI